MIKIHLLSFLSAKVGDKYISHIFLFTLAASSITSRSRPAPTKESGLSADLASTTLPHLKRMYRSFSEALSISLDLPITIRFQTSLNIMSALSYDKPTSHILLLG